MTREVDETLTLSAERMRALGHEVVDLIVENLTTLAERPVSRTGSRRELDALLREDPPSLPRAPERVLKRVREIVLENMIHVDHPRNFGYVPGPGNYVGALGDFLASGFNVFAGTWLEGSGAAAVELVTLDWLKSLCGLPDAASGVFVSGGSQANLTALLVAREHQLPGGPAKGVWYASDQTHSSMERAFRVLGFRDDQARRLPSDVQHRLSVPALERAVRDDRAAGLEPFCVVANAGTTNTGAVDPLLELLRFREREDLWLHVDGAYGAPAVVSPRGKALLGGLGEADSISLDPHKWLFQPYGLGCALIREGPRLERCFRVHPDYLQDVAPGEQEVNFCDAGIELTRPFRALKLWLTVQLFGLDAIRAGVDRGIDLAEHAQACLAKVDRFELTSEAQLGIVSFRYLPVSTEDADAFNRKLSRAVIEDGFTLVSSTVLGGRVVLRMCTINPRTTLGDIESSVTRVRDVALRLDGVSSG